MIHYERIRMHRETTMYMLIQENVKINPRSKKYDDWFLEDRINFLSRRRDDIEKIWNFLNKSVKNLGYCKKRYYYRFKINLNILYFFF